jgi:hypothetical protein
MGDLKRLCRSTTLYGGDFAGLVLAAGTPVFPYLHAIHAKEYVPEGLKPTGHDLKTMASAKVGRMSPDVAKAFGKIDQIFVQRRQLVGHMFYMPDHAIWHFFYFDQRDTSTRRNHWKAGSHIHLVNFLWPKRTAENVWHEFNSGNVQMKGSLHLRFIMRDESLYETAP